MKQNGTTKEQQLCVCEGAASMKQNGTTKEQQLL